MRSFRGLRVGWQLLVVLLLLCVALRAHAVQSTASSVAQRPLLQLTSLSCVSAVLSPSFAPAVTRYNMTAAGSWPILELHASVAPYTEASPLVLQMRTSGWDSFPWELFPATGRGAQWNGGPGLDLRILNNVTGEFRIVTLLQQVHPALDPATTPKASDATVASIDCTALAPSDPTPILLPSFAWSQPNYQLLLNIDPQQPALYRCVARLSNPLARVALFWDWKPIEPVVPPAGSNGTVMFDNRVGSTLIVISEDGTQAAQYSVSVHAQGALGPKDTSLYYMYPAGGLLPISIPTRLYLRTCPPGIRAAGACLRASCSQRTIWARTFHTCSCAVAPPTGWTHRAPGLPNRRGRILPGRRPTRSHGHLGRRHCAQKLLRRDV
jgi:hypothetical protein